MNKSILSALINYKKLIDENKDTTYKLSSYTVKKPWGEEKWLELNEYYTMKLIKMFSGNRSSLQSHKLKVETNYILDGQVELLLEGEDGKMESFLLSAGSGWSVKPKQKHRVVALSDYTAIEVSTPHLDDVVRYEDDSDRKSGKIEKEHGI